MSGTPFTCRWGILATGGIAHDFAKDLLVDPKTRSVTDVKHTVQAAASSTSADRAKKFLEDIGAPSSATAYGSYEELVADPNVDIIYIATPHSHHFQCAVLALKAGKNVLCEKPFTVTAKQTKILSEIAKEKGLFLMEAVWTRFFPLSIEVRDMISQGKLGEVRRVVSDLSLAQDPEKRYADGQHRMVNPELAGSVLLDLGFYPITWIYQCLYHVLPPSQRTVPSVTGVMNKFEKTGVDAENCIICNFPRAMGIGMSSVYVADNPGESGQPAVRIYGTKAEVQVIPNSYRPEKIRIIGVEPGSKVEEKEFPIHGKGMFWQADASARALRDGRTECEEMPLAESHLVMETMDKWREVVGLKYPEAIEKTDH